jgi:hypothetical protein
MNIGIYTTNLYGHLAVYPVTESVAKTLQALTGKKTLSSLAHLKALEELGCKFTLVGQIDPRALATQSMIEYLRKLPTV